VRYGGKTEARRHPGNDALDEVGRRLGHPPARPRGTKPPPLATEGQEDPLLAGVTAKPQKAMDKGATLHIVVKFTSHIRGQAFGIRIVIE
jgi:hypothetical protein